MTDISKRYKIDLDSNVFRNQSFINWTIKNKDIIEVNISVITYFETLFFYLTRSLTIDDFNNDLQDLSASVYSLDKALANKVVKKAIKCTLPFKHHARDFIIGTTALERGAVLLTYNVKRFKSWMPKASVFTPEDFLESVVIT
ncbi:MAG: type II toxin-antitoxin system VapC family toxin [Candidatus Hodarchaeales archaeon]